MARKGIKIKALADELGVSSKAVIHRCRTEGIPAQNSITKLQPHVERQVRAWFAEEEQAGHGQEDGTT